MVVTTEQATISMIALKYVAAKWSAVSWREIGWGEVGRGGTISNLPQFKLSTFADDDDSPAH